jgi:hypothetical protein
MDIRYQAMQAAMWHIERKLTTETSLVAVVKASPFVAYINQLKKD